MLVSLVRCSTMPRQNVYLLLILITSAVLRFALVLSTWSEPSRYFTPDSYDYNTLAHSLLEDGQFVRAGSPEIFRTPGYPTFLAGIYALTGNSIHAVIIVQAFLDILLCYLVFRLGRMLFSEAVGLVAAVIQAISPVMIAYCCRVLSETLFAFLIVSMLLLLLNKGANQQVKLIFPAGVIMGIACLVRPVGLIAAIIIVIFLLVARRFRSAIVFAVASAMIIMPWLARNYFKTGYRGFAGVADYNLFYYNARALMQSDRSIVISSTAQRLIEENPIRESSPPDYARLNNPAFLSLCRSEGMKIICRHPGRYLLVHLRGMQNIFLPAATDVLEIAGLTTGMKGTLEVIRQEGLWAGVKHYFADKPWAIWLCLPMVLITLVKFVFAMVGLVRCAIRRIGFDFWLMVAVGVSLILLPGPAGHPRFRVPIAAIISIISAVGIVGIKSQSSSRP